jgi:hypothetical protein
MDEDSHSLCVIVLPLTHVLFIFLVDFLINYLKITVLDSFSVPLVPLHVSVVKAQLLEVVIIQYIITVLVL